MRLSLGVPAFAVLAAAVPAPAPQEIDVAMVIAAPDPTYTQVVGVTAQLVTYTDLAAQATAAVSSVSIAISDVLSNTAIVKRTACATQPTGVSSYAVTATDNASAFLANSAFAAAATSAPVPAGYDNTFTNLQASNNAYGYMGFTTLNSYDTNLCASKCNAINGCMSFNLYFERDPSVDPGTGCDNPSSVTMIKCVFWGGPVTSANANNAGQYRDNFQVVIAGSNGYVNKTLEVPSGFSFTADLGSSTINAPYDKQGYNTYMGATIFSAGPFNASLCAQYCTDQTTYNVQHPASDGSPPKICNFFTTYLLYDNNTSHYQGQYCSLYTEAWTSSYSTNTGYWYGSDHYQIDHSYSYTNVSSPGVDPTKGDKNGAIHQASVDITYATLQTYCSTLLGYTTPVTTVTSTTTVTPITTVSSTSIVIVTSTGSYPGAKKRQDSDYSLVTLYLLPTQVAGTTYSSLDAITTVSTVYSSAAVEKRTASASASASTPNVLTKYPSSVVSSACLLLATPVTSTSTTVVSTTTTTAASFTTTTVGVTSASTSVAAACPTNAQANNVLQGTNGCYCSYVESCGKLVVPAAYEYPVGTMSSYTACVAECDHFSNCGGLSYGLDGSCLLYVSGDGVVNSSLKGDGSSGRVAATRECLAGSNQYCY